MKEKNRFLYLDDVEKYDPSNAYVAFISSDISNIKDLFKEYYKKLNFPGYFGHNWNALIDCLRDFEWMNQKRILIIHKALPNLNSNDLKNYIEVLDIVLRDLNSRGNDYELVIIFPQSVKEIIDKIRSEFNKKA